jgi:twitching motility protein PilT
MSQKKPPLIGRLAVQLKLITPQQLAEATEAQGDASGAGFGTMLIEKGWINAKQLEKLESVQKDLIAKHRAQQAAAAGGQTDRPAPAAARNVVSPPTRAPAATERERSIHGAAERALQDAAPTTAETALELGEPVSRQAARRAPPAATAPVQTPAASAPASAARQPALDSTQVTAEPSDQSGAAGSLGLRLGEPDADAHAQLHQILAEAVAAGASDIHFHSGGELKLRIHGELKPHGSLQLDRATAERLVAAALTSEQRDELRRDGELDLCIDIAGTGRFRANAYRQQRGFDLVLRSVSSRPPTLEELGLPSELARLTDYHQGMVLLTGPTGCGKSATLAAMVDLINASRDDHILCVEDPIEVLHPPKRCLVNQRHAGRHTGSFARALRGALREDPDVIVIGELRDLETISLAMTAAETGHFVLATLHTNNAVRTINRMIGAFPSAEQAQVRAMLSESLRAVVSQRLVARADGSGRVPALEVLIINKAIGNLIRDEKTVQIRSSMQTGRSHGMYLLEQSLNDLVVSGQITRETALHHAEEKKLITAGA